VATVTLVVAAKTQDIGKKYWLAPPPEICDCEKQNKADLDNIMK